MISPGSTFPAFLSALECHLIAFAPSPCSKDDMGICFQGQIPIQYSQILLNSQTSSLLLGVTCSGSHHAVLTHSLHIWIPSMLKGISKRDEGLVKKYKYPGFTRSISWDMLGDPWKVLDVLRILGISSAHESVWCIQHHFDTRQTLNSATHLEMLTISFLLSY